MSILRSTPKQKQPTINGLIDEINATIIDTNVALGSIEESASKLGADIAEQPESPIVTAETALGRLQNLLSEVKSLHCRALRCSNGLANL